MATISTSIDFSSFQDSKENLAQWSRFLSFRNRGNLDRLLKHNNDLRRRPEKVVKSGQKKNPLEIFTDLKNLEECEKMNQKYFQHFSSQLMISSFSSWVNFRKSHFKANLRTSWRHRYYKGTTTVTILINDARAAAKN